ncbi:hypothetical protein Ciccas_004482 [Cichlidogyrus casuarinus]|uniref:Uncharacterized protein n=1 Tax=Cichlidogyrus casuarinus TaxID=1844966 RepID=A0ABD2QBD7_9PLAT
MQEEPALDENKEPDSVKGKPELNPLSYAELMAHFREKQREARIELDKLYSLNQEHDKVVAELRRERKQKNAQLRDLEKSFQDIIDNRLDCLNADGTKRRKTFAQLRTEAAEIFDLIKRDSFK